MRLLLLCFILGIIHTIAHSHSSSGRSSFQSPELVDEARERTSLRYNVGQSQEGTHSAPLQQKILTAEVAQEYLEELKDDLLTRTKYLIDQENLKADSLTTIGNLIDHDADILQLIAFEIKHLAETIVTRKTQVDTYFERLFADKSNAEESLAKIKSDDNRNQLLTYMGKIISRILPSRSDYYRNQLRENIAKIDHYRSVDHRNQLLTIAIMEFGGLNWLEDFYSRLYRKVSDKLQYQCRSKWNEIDRVKCEYHLRHLAEGSRNSKRFVNLMEEPLRTKVEKLVNEKVSFEAFEENSSNGYQSLYQGRKLV